MARSFFAPSLIAAISIFVTTKLLAPIFGEKLAGVVAWVSVARMVVVKTIVVRTIAAVG